MTLTPRHYQEVGRDFLASRRHALLADEMRVGKTPQAILAAHKAGAKSIAVICPAIARLHWQREFQKWWPGAMLPRIATWSYAKATDLWNSGLRGNVDLLIPDECHFAKNPEALRTKMVYGKDGFGYHAGAIWALSGTPAPKHAGELWPMLRAFGVVGMTYEEYCRRYCTYDWTQTRVTGTKVEHIPELKALLATIMLRRTRKQVAPEMPDIGYEFLEVDTGGADYELPAFAAGHSNEALTDWLSVRPDFDRENRVDVALAKCEPLVEEIAFAIENGLLKQTVVFGWHLEPLLAGINVALRRRGISVGVLVGETSSRARELVQEQFRSGEIQVVVANILAAGTAIDLSVADHGYFLELDWVSGNNVQAANRLISMDKDEPVTFDVVTAPGTTDDRVQKVLLRRVKELGKLFT